MPQVTITIPAEQVGPVVDVLLSLYGTKGESIFAAVESVDADETDDALAALAAHRTEMRAIGAAIDQLGWSTAERQRPAALTTDRALAVESAQAILHKEAETLVDATEDFAVPDGDLAPIDAALTSTTAARDFLADAAGVVTAVVTGTL